MEVCEKRIKRLFTAVLIVFILLIVRLFCIQIIGLEESKAVSYSQYNSGLHGINYRGDILDRNGVSFVNRAETYIMLIDKIKYDDNAEKYLAELDAERLSIDNRRYYGFKTDDYNERIIEVLKAEYGSYVFVGTQRYTYPQPAAHIIGYCNNSENKGIYGLERKYNDVLVSDGELSLTVDSVGRILPGYGLNYSSDKEGGKVYTSLDYEIQKIGEKALKKYAVKGGAVIIADAENGGILCSASYPIFYPVKTDEAYGSSLVNKAVQTSYPPGSVFKIIVAAAAIEEGIVKPGDIFTCSGRENLFGVEIKCGKKEGHGEITFEEGFSKSCNCVFIQLGRELGSEKILEMAERFGLGEKVLCCLEEESSGCLADDAQTAGAGIGNLSIGQGETEITCVQATEIAGIVACYGYNPNLHLIEAKEQIKEEKIVSFRTALILRNLMCQVVEDGTGRRAGADSAGKSGSAQSYINGEKKVHGWYTGFFPVDNPEYIVSVFVEDGGGAAPAVSIFAQIHKELNNLK